MNSNIDSFSEYKFLNNNGFTKRQSRAAVISLQKISKKFIPKLDTEKLATKKDFYDLKCELKCDLKDLEGRMVKYMFAGFITIVLFLVKIIYSL